MDCVSVYVCVYWATARTLCHNSVPVVAVAITIIHHYHCSDAANSYSSLLSASLTCSDSGQLKRTMHVRVP